MKPIIFSGPMVRVILDGRKTQTRRVIKFKIPRKDCVWCKGHGFEFIEAGELSAYDYRRPCRCTFPEPRKKGDLLWVKETHWQYKNRKELAGYCADGERTFEHPVKKYPSIFMPRWASRITLEIVNVRVERLQDITEEDVDKEGFEGDYPHKVMPDIFSVNDSGMTMIECFAKLWDSMLVVNHSRLPTAWIGRGRD